MSDRPTPRVEVFRGKCHSYHKNDQGRTLIEEAELVERELAEAREQRDRLEDSMIRISEYWNGSENENAMADFCHFAVAESTSALAAVEGGSDE